MTFSLRTGLFIKEFEHLARLQPPQTPIGCMNLTIFQNKRGLLLATLE